MRETDLKAIHQEAAAGAAAQAPADDGYAPVAGRKLEDVENLRALESQAAAKTASDYQHIVWAYGILWALFAAYGLFLWRRSAALRRDMDALRRAQAGQGTRG